MLQNDLVPLIRSKSIPIKPIATDYPLKLTRLSPIRSVVFDVYGTLFVSASGDISLVQNQDRECLFVQALDESGFAFIEANRPPSIDQLFKSIVLEDQATIRSERIPFPEVDICQVWTRLVEMGQSQGWLKDSGSINHLAIRFELLSNPIYPMPDLGATLKQIQKMDLPMGIVSNAQFYTKLLFPAFLDCSLSQLGFLDDLCVWSYELLAGKPSLLLFEELLKQAATHKISPHEVLYVGNDLRNDIYPAQTLGMKTVLFAGDQRSLRLRDGDPLCDGIVPDAVIHSLSDLFQLF